MFRIAFNPSLPVVAAQPFTARGRKFVSGDVVDWRTLGITEQMLYEWWLSHLVVHPLASKVPLGGVTVDESATGQRRSRKRKPAEVDSLSDAELERLTRPE